MYTNIIFYILTLKCILQRKQHYYVTLLHTFIEITSMI